MASNNSELFAIQRGIARLRKSNRWLMLGLSESDFNNPDLQEYLSRPLDQDINKDQEIENKVKAAVYLAVRRSKWKPRHAAKKLAEASVEALRDARLMTLHESNHITSKRLNEELENNQISKIASTFNHVKKRYGRKATKAALTIAVGATVGGPAAAIAGGIMLASELIPKKTKEKIKRNIRNTVKTIGESISNGVSRICERAVESAPRIAKKVYETFTSVSERISQYAAPIVETVKEVKEKVVKKAKKIWRRLFG